jgi:hypothetical protein
MQKQTRTIITKVSGCLMPNGTCTLLGLGQIAHLSFMYLDLEHIYINTLQLRQRNTFTSLIATCRDKTFTVAIFLKICHNVGTVLRAFKFINRK